MFCVFLNCFFLKQKQFSKTINKPTLKAKNFDTSTNGYASEVVTIVYHHHMFESLIIHAFKCITGKPYTPLHTNANAEKCQLKNNWKINHMMARQKKKNKTRTLWKVD